MQTFRHSYGMLIPYWSLMFLFTVYTATTSATTTADPLAYRNINGTYQAFGSANVTTLLDFINARSDLSSLASALNVCGGFTEAFSTDATWDYTFFAPNNDAFEQYTGRYFQDNAETPKGKWWMGNTIIHHYVPNTALDLSAFSSTYQRFQTATYLYVGAQIVDGDLTLNQVAKVVEGDFHVSKDPGSFGANI
ncbi:hypothetical protein N7474_008780 [Penicillium riverlandense]|uniref:uncharacterized protein n=1 Tax=Penicillium riverlandense TaxID=1903569 RepID=UPI002547213C|nr:uncharacterized protein N7474_008780 [Penicillium riverlandense]KAJ5812479.1 hypothetical protein N7474_008780 [Penicillium riverlandense]